MNSKKPLRPVFDADNPNDRDNADTVSEAIKELETRSAAITQAVVPIINLITTKLKHKQKDAGSEGPNQNGNHLSK